MSSPLYEAKVKDDYRAGPVLAFSGHEYIRNEWRPVPLGSEKEAQAHALLDVRLAEPRKAGTPSQPAVQTPAAADHKPTDYPRGGAVATLPTEVEPSVTVVTEPEDVGQDPDPEVLEPDPSEKKSIRRRSRKE